MVVAETLAGIALVQQAVKAIKGGLDTAKDLSSLATDIDNLFTGERQIQQKRNKRQQSAFSMKSVAEETIQAKLAQEQMREIASMIDMRFGHGTWTSIVAERAKRIQDHKDEIRQQQKEKRRQQEEMMDAMKTTGYAFLGILFVAGCLIAVLMGMRR